MNERVQNFFDRLKEVWGRMELRQRLMIAVLMALTFVLIVWMISFSIVKPEYEYLMGSLSVEDAQKVREYLRENKIKFEYRDSNRSFYVPKEALYDTRLSLASENIGKSETGIGYEIFDRTTLGTTERVQEINFLRARQGELEKTILSINGVEDVRVHLVDPRDRLFAADQRDPTASIRLTLSRRLPQATIVSITRWVANAVEGLNEENITIIDQNGNELTQRDDDTFATTADRQMRQQIQRESLLIERVQSALDRVLGAGNSYVLLSAELNFDQVESTSLIYDPEGQVTMSEQIQTSSTTNLRDSVATTSELITANYELSRTEQRRVAAVGDIKRLTVAAFVNYQRTRETDEETGKVNTIFVPRSDADLERLEATIRTAVGFNAERGDDISVANLLFEGTDDEFAMLEREREAQIERYFSLAQQAAIFIVLIVLIFVLNSQFKKIFAEPEPEIEEEEEEEEEILEEEDLRPALAEDGVDEGFYPEGEEGMPMGDGKISFTFKPMRDIEIEQTEAMLLQETIQKFVIENPEVAVKLMKSWLMDEAPVKFGKK